MAPRVNSDLLLVGSLPADSADSALRAEPRRGRGAGDRIADRDPAAARYLPDFGVAMYCGFGRQPGADGTETMREHARVVRQALRFPAASG